MENFNSKIYKLTAESINEMAALDNGSIKSVLRGLRRHCYGISSDQELLKNIDFIYINESSNELGYIFKLKLGENHFYELLLMFSHFLTNVYDDLDTIKTYNTFIEYFRTLLESKNILTITSRELENQNDKNLTIMSSGPIEIVKNFKSEDLFKFILKTDDTIEINEYKNYLYLMLNLETNYFKIGRSKNPEYREKTLQSKEPQIKILKIWECDIKIEKLLHKKFKDKKIRGEWFKLSFEDISNFDKIIEELKVLLPINAHLQ